MTIDHILYVGPDLGDLVRDLERLAGVEAAVGGTHPGQGTRNSLVDLGDYLYLELMAPDPAQAKDLERHDAADGAVARGEESPSPDVAAAPPFTFHRSIAYATTPRLFTWCAKARDAGSFAAAARALGLRVTTFPGSRRTPAGTELRWDLITVSGHGLGGAVPFFIDWRDSPHPARSVRMARTGPGLRLVELELRHPDSRGLTNLMAALSEAALGGAGGSAGAGASLGSSAGTHGADPDGPRLSIKQSTVPGLTARFVGARGPFELTGSGGELRP